MVIIICYYYVVINCPRAVLVWPNMVFRAVSIGVELECLKPSLVNSLYDTVMINY